MVEISASIQTLTAIACLLLMLALLAFARVASKAEHGSANPLLKTIASAYLPEWLRPFFVLACIPACFVMVEYPYQGAVFDIGDSLLFTNLLFIGIVVVVVFLLFQRSRIAVCAISAIFFVVGAANYFVALFKGQAILPSDALSVGTAANVWAGYMFTIDDALAQSFALLLSIFLVAALLPRVKVRLAPAIVSMVAAGVIAFAGYSYFSDLDYQEDLDVKIDVWGNLGSYREQGSIVCFLDGIQQLTPEEPEGYSREAVESILDGTNEGPAAGLVDELQKPTIEGSMPTIITIMNETFADISTFSAVDDSYHGPTLFKNLMNESLISGNTYVSAYSGGTCNSEFEYLTGSSNAFLGLGVYPYVLYDFKGVDNIASHLKSLGYSTSAIHPEHKSNWRRDRVYAELGFDNFYGIEEFEDAPMRRRVVTDEATYDFILDLLEKVQDPQFIFDVTIANHGGYDTGELDKRDTIETKVNGKVDSEVSEYTSIIRLSDIEFSNFIKKLSNMDRPIVVCMFGDHQSNLANDLAVKSFGVGIDQMSIEQTQSRYTTPYLIWTNDDGIRQAWKGLDSLASSEKAANSVKDVDASLNYLGAMTLKASGLPLDRNQAFQLAMHKYLPALNLNGFMSAQGKWRWKTDSELEKTDPVTREAYRELELVQHHNLFDSRK